MDHRSSSHPRPPSRVGPQPTEISRGECDYIFSPKKIKNQKIRKAKGGLTFLSHELIRYIFTLEKIDLLQGILENKGVVMFCLIRTIEISADSHDTAGP